jgi:hypothetical protein
VPVPDPTSNHHDYEVTVIQRFGTHFPDPTTVKWPGFACIPLPNDYTVPHKGLAIVRGPSVPPKPEDATSYLEMWAGFAVRHTVPDPFQHLFEATRSLYNPLDTHDAMLGYGIVCRMADTHDGVLDRHAIHMFLVTLAAFERTLQLSVGQDSLWRMLLEREPECSFNNWGELQAFINFEASSPHENFGLAFIPPADPSQPWEVCTHWRRDNFMQVLLAMRPSLPSLRQLLAYADIFICTRPAAQPLPGIPLDEPLGQMYTTPFFSGPNMPEVFIVDTSLMVTEPSGDMEVDENPSAPPASENALHALP